MQRDKHIHLLLQLIDRYHLDDRLDKARMAKQMARHGMLSDSMAKAFLVSFEAYIDHQKDFPNDGLPLPEIYNWVGDYLHVIHFPKSVSGALGFQNLGVS